MQISRFFGHGRSGFYCARSIDLPPPQDVQPRMKRLMSLSREPDSGFRLGIEELIGRPLNLADYKPTLSFVRDRWPRYVYEQQDPEIFEAVRSSTLGYRESHNLDGAQIQDSLRLPFSLSIQFFCHQGTVFQRYRAVETNFNHEASRLKIHVNALIKNLDFLDDSALNAMSSEDPVYTCRLGPRRRSIIVHQCTREERELQKIANGLLSSTNEHPKAISLIITAFVNGLAQEITPDESSWYIEFNRHTRNYFSKTGTVEVVMAYRLQLLEERPKWTSLVVPGSHLSALMNEFSEDSRAIFEKLEFSTHPGLDFVIRRNLAHVLFVCSIPVPEESWMRQSDTQPLWESGKDEERTPIALTCGDIAGHRVLSSASLYVRPHPKT